MEVWELLVRSLFPIISDVLGIDILLGERLLFLLWIEGNSSIGTPLLVSLILTCHVPTYHHVPHRPYVSSQTSHWRVSRASCYQLRAENSGISYFDCSSPMTSWRTLSLIQSTYVISFYPSCIQEQRWLTCLSSRYRNNGITL